MQVACSRVCDDKGHRVGGHALAHLNTGRAVQELGGVLEAAAPAAAGLVQARRVAGVATGDADIGALVTLGQPHGLCFHKAHQPVVLTAQAASGCQCWGPHNFTHDRSRPRLSETMVGNTVLWRMSAAPQWQGTSHDTARIRRAAVIEHL